jgi:ATP-binding cassette, subfamily B, multidrug efflux pump
VLRQSLGFFQNDFAGRIANKIIQTGPSLREVVVSLIDAIWFISIYTISALVIFVEMDARLTVPIFVWLAFYVGVLALFVPRIKQRAMVMSEARSMLTGRIVDSYSNIMTVKLFAHADREDGYAREAIRDHTAKFHRILRNITQMNGCLHLINGFMITGTSAFAVLLWQAGAISVGAIAVATGLAIRLSNMSGWIMWVVTGLFENIGTVEEGMETISRPYQIVDAPNALPLQVARGEIQFDHVSFNYGRAKGVLEDLSLTVRPGERVGLIGRSGAGKSTVVSLLLRFYDIEKGRILIDGQDIAGVTQDSLRRHPGYLAAASLGRREHPLWPGQRQPRGDRRRRAPGGSGTVHCRS